jgi:hypothetical protein
MEPTLTAATEWMRAAMGVGVCIVFGNQRLNGNTQFLDMPIINIASKILAVIGLLERLVMALSPKLA